MLATRAVWWSEGFDRACTRLNVGDEDQRYVKSLVLMPIYNEARTAMVCWQIHAGRTHSRTACTYNIRNTTADSAQQGTAHSVGCAYHRLMWYLPSIPIHNNRSAWHQAMSSCLCRMEPLELYFDRQSGSATPVEISQIAWTWIVSA